MKIRGAMVKPAAFLASCLLRVWLGTVRYRFRETIPGVVPETPGLTERFIYLFWHESLLIPTKVYARVPLRILVSEHADGEFITQTVRHLGARTIRGSKTRGGARALREMAGLDDRFHVALTPDGPRGPRRQMQFGAVALASLTGRRIVPIGFAFSRCWRARSWDRFAVPYPFSPAVGLFGAPLAVPPDLNRAGRKEFLSLAQAGLDDATARAEEWASRERF